MLYGAGRSFDVFLNGPRKRAHRSIPHQPADPIYGLKITRTRNRKPGLDHIYAEIFQLAGETQLLLLIELAARHLLAITKRCVEDVDLCLLHFSLALSNTLPP